MLNPMQSEGLGLIIRSPTVMTGGGNELGRFEAGKWLVCLKYGDGRGKEESTTYGCMKDLC